MPDGDKQAVSEHCRALATAFAHAEAEDPVEDPTFRQLLVEVAEFPHPVHVLQMLAAMVLFGLSEVNQVGEGEPPVTLDGMETEMLLDRIAPPVATRRCFAVLREMARPARDQEALRSVLRPLSEAHGGVAVVALTHMYVSLAITVTQSLPDLTVDDVLADWAVREAASLERPE